MSALNLNGWIMYKCRLCGERFQVNNDISAVDENQSMIHRLSQFKPDVMIIKHQCEENKSGIADAIGWVRDGK